MNLHQIESKIAELKAAEKQAHKQLGAIVNGSNFRVKMMANISTSEDVLIDSLFDAQIWDMLQTKARAELSKAQQAIKDFESKFND